MAGAGQVRAGRAYVELGVDDRMAAGLAKASRRLRAFGAQVQAVGMGLMKMGALVAAPLALGVKAFADFEEQMAFVSTMLGKDAPKYMDRYSQAIKDMAVASGESTATLAKGLYDLLSAQIAAADALDVLNVAMRAAIGGKTDVATSTKALVRVLKSYNLEADQAADVSDVLFRVVEKGVITYDELAEHIGTVAPSARAAGLSLDELAAAIATVVAIEEPARAMTALRQAIFEAAEEGEDFLSFIRRFEGADLGKIIEAGIPKRAALGVVILSQNLELLDENLAAMTDRVGAADRAYEAMAGTLKRDFLRILQAIKIAFTEIGNTLAGNVKDGTERILEIIAATTEWIKENGELIKKIAKLTIKLLAAGAALWVAGGLIKGVAALFAGLNLLMAHPIVLVIAAIALLGVAIGKIITKQMDLAEAASRANAEMARIPTQKQRYEPRRTAEGYATHRDEAWGLELAAEAERRRRRRPGEAAAPPSLVGPAATFEKKLGDWESEQARRAERVADYEQRLNDDIAAARIEATKTGLARELALIDLRKQQELRAAEDIGEVELALIDKKYKLEKDLAEQREADLEAVRAGMDAALDAATRPLEAARGTFNALAALGLQTGADRPIKRVADGIDKLNETQRRALREAIKAGYVFA